MDFRWVAGLTLWTVLSGPVLVDVVALSNASRQQNVPVVRTESTPWAGPNNPGNAYPQAPR